MRSNIKVRVGIIPPPVAKSSSFRQPSHCAVCRLTRGNLHFCQTVPFIKRKTELLKKYCRSHGEVRHSYFNKRSWKTVSNKQSGELLKNT